MIGEIHMQNILERIKHILMQEYEFEVFGVHRMPTGVGGGDFEQISVNNECTKKVFYDKI
jgi:hypothetical protein